MALAFFTFINHKTILKLQIIVSLSCMYTLVKNTSQKYSYESQMLLFAITPQTFFKSPKSLTTAFNESKHCAAET